jgi:hypothetical protein
MTMIAILGADVARERLDECGEYDEIVVLEPSVDELEHLIDELRDPRLDYLLGELPVLPLPDGCVDRVLGGDPPDHPEIARVTAS